MTNMINHLLDILEVKHSNKFIVDNYVYGPDNDNLLGIQKILRKYGIKSTGVRFEDKMNAEITLPCICCLDDRFVLLQKVDEGQVYYIDQDQKKVEEESVFCQKWTGIALLIDDLSKSNEPAYWQNKFFDWYSGGIYIFLLVSLCASVIFAADFKNEFLLINDFFCIIGLLFCLLIIHKGLNKDNTIIDKTCTILKAGDCDFVLNDKRASLLNLFTWGEIGLSYFTSSLIYLLIFTKQALVVQSVGWLAMPYALWSIWYQLFVLKRICILCCFTQIVIWGMGIYNIYNIYHVKLSLLYYAEYATIFASILIIINTIYKFEIINQKFLQQRSDLLRIKYDKTVSSALFQSQEHIVVTTSDSNIIFGNDSAINTITVVTNPYCSQCAKVHDKLLSLVKNNKDIKVQYIFMQQDNASKNISLFLIASYLFNNTDNFLSIMFDWYNRNQKSAKSFISNYNVDLHAVAVIREYDNHRKWCQKNSVSYTPYILYNGVHVPQYYDIEDLENILL